MNTLARITLWKFLNYYYTVKCQITLFLADSNAMIFLIRFYNFINMEFNYLRARTERVHSFITQLFWCKTACWQSYLVQFLWGFFGCWFLEVLCFGCLIFQLQSRATEEALQRTSNSWCISNDKWTVSFLIQCGYLWSRWWVYFSEQVSYIYILMQQYFVSLTKTDWPHQISMLHTAGEKTVQ